MTGPAHIDRALIGVSGPDTIGFLNSLLTQDVEKLPEAGVQYAALLSPQGKVVADMALWAEGDGVIVEADPVRGPELLRRLAMYKLRAAVAIEDITGDVHVLFAPTPFSGARPDPRFPEGALGWRKICPLPTEHRDFPNGAAAYDALRLALGVPDLARDAAPEEVFGLEALLEELHGVEFQKGCFVGQENVSRMKRRATTRRKFCPVSFLGDPLPFGTPVLAGGADIGSVRASASGRALALIRLDRALEAPGNLSCAGRPVRLDPPRWLSLPAGA